MARPYEGRPDRLAPLVGAPAVRLDVAVDQQCPTISAHFDHSFIDL
jgi:hypothetical protein